MPVSHYMKIESFSVFKISVKRVVNEKKSPRGNFTVRQSNCRALMGLQAKETLSNQVLQSEPHRWGKWAVDYNGKIYKQGEKAIQS